MNYARALLILRPGAQWSIGETYDSLQWLDPSPKPTKEELEAVDVNAETLEEKLARIRADTDAVYASLPIAVQAAFAPIYVAAKDFIARGKTDVAAALIAAQTVPAELESTRQEILSHLK